LNNILIDFIEKLKEIKEKNSPKYKKTKNNIIKINFKK